MTCLFSGEALVSLIFRARRNIEKTKRSYCYCPHTGKRCSSNHSDLSVLSDANVLLMRHSSQHWCMWFSWGSVQHHLCLPCCWAQGLPAEGIIRCWNPVPFTFSRLSKAPRVLILSNLYISLKLRTPSVDVCVCFWYTSNAFAKLNVSSSGPLPSAPHVTSWFFTWN